MLVLETTYLLLLLAITSAVNVVVFLPGTQRHERRGLERIAQYLALKNHGVITFKAIIIPEVRQLVMPKLHLVEELAIRDSVPKKIYDPILSAGELYPWKKGIDAWEYQTPLWKANSASCEKILDSDLIMKLRKNKIELAVVYAEHPCHLQIVHSLNIPFIYYDTRGFSADTAIASGSGILSGISSLTVSIKDYPKQIGVSVSKQGAAIFQALVSYLPYLPFEPLRSLNPRYKHLDAPINKVAKEHEKNFDISSVKRHAALYFVNGDPLLEPADRRTATNVVYVGGAHMEYPRPLFAPWNESIALARDGVIIVSFGEFANASAMPHYIAEALLRAFRTLPTYRVFWRIGTPTMPGFKKKEIPKNVNFTQFLPQTDLLGNKNARLLISHGGVDSMMEALHLGVPVLGIPLFGSNLETLEKMENRGVAKIIRKEEINDEKMLQAIRNILQNRYRTKAKQISKIVKDRPVDSFETAIHWIESVARNPIIFSSSKHRIPIWKIFLTDVISTEIGCAFLIIAASLATWLQYQMCMLLHRSMFGRRVSQSNAHGHSNGFVPRDKE